MSYSDDLDWLARNVNDWPDGTCSYIHMMVIKEIKYPSWSRYDGDGKYTKAQWLARRAELQNKPNWNLSPSWALHLAQDQDGEWKWLGDNVSQYVDGWTAGKLRAQCKGAVLGDWRDTLERRTAELSEQAVTERLAETTKIVLAAAPALMDEKFSFDRNDWHERGELPPVGTRCEALITSERQWVEIEVVCHRDGFALGWCPKERCGYHGDEPTDFRPIRTERDLAVDEMKRHCPYHGSWETTYRLFAESLYDAGYRAGGFE